MDRSDGRFPWWLGAVAAAFVVLVGLVVVGSLDRRPPPARPPSPGGLARPDSTGARTVTLDARSPDRWLRFDLSEGRTVAPGAGAWDIAVQRYHVIVNGGEALPGDGAAALTADTALEAGGPVPRDGWRTTRADRDGRLRHPLLEEWYDYDFFSHVLRPRPRVWAVRTPDGGVYRLRFLSYYCPGPEAGCLTFRYARAGRSVARGSAEGGGREVGR